MNKADILEAKIKLLGEKLLPYFGWLVRVIFIGGLGWYFSTKLTEVFDISLSYLTLGDLFYALGSSIAVIGCLLWLFRIGSHKDFEEKKLSLEMWGSFGLLVIGLLFIIGLLVWVIRLD